MNRVLSWPKGVPLPPEHSSEPAWEPPIKTYRAFSREERMVLDDPADVSVATPAQLARLSHLGLIELYFGRYQVTKKGKTWRRLD